MTGPGLDHDYAVIVENLGPDTANNVALSITLPAPAALTSAVPVSCTTSGQTITAVMPRYRFWPGKS